MIFPGDMTMGTTLVCIGKFSAFAPICFSDATSPKVLRHTPSDMESIVSNIDGRFGSSAVFSVTLSTVSDFFGDAFPMIRVLKLSPPGF